MIIESECVCVCVCVCVSLSEGDCLSTHLWSQTCLLLLLIMLSYNATGFFFFSFSANKHLKKLEDCTHSFRCFPSIHIIVPNVWAFWHAVRYTLASHRSLRPCSVHTQLGKMLSSVSSSLRCMQGSHHSRFDVDKAAAQALQTSRLRLDC